MDMKVKIICTWKFYVDHVKPVEKLEVYEQKKNGSAKQISLESFVKKRNEASLGCVGEC